MRAIILLPFLVVVILISPFSGMRFNKSNYFPGRTKIIGLYDEDSVLRTMNGFISANDSLKKWDKINKPKLDSMNNAYSNKIDEFNRDSAKWSPLFKAIRRKDLYDMMMRNQNLEKMLNNDRLAYKQFLFLPLHEKISSAAKNLQVEKKYDLVMNKELYEFYLLDDHGKLKLVNVTLEMQKLTW
jgi:hypothetical protein